MTLLNWGKLSDGWYLFNRPNSLDVLLRHDLFLFAYSIESGSVFLYPDTRPPKNHVNLLKHLSEFAKLASEQVENCRSNWHDLINNAAKNVGCTNNLKFIEAPQYPRTRNKFKDNEYDVHVNFGFVTIMIKSDLTYCVAYNHKMASILGYDFNIARLFVNEIETLGWRLFKGREVVNDSPSQ